MKKQINITIDKDLEVKVKEKIEDSGGKLSTLIDKLLKDFVRRKNE